MCPAVPASRPIMESSANWYRRVMRSPAVMAALVGGPEYLRGRGACAASPAGTRASAPNMANERHDITRVLVGGNDGGDEPPRKVTQPARSMLHRRRPG